MTNPDLETSVSNGSISNAPAINSLVVLETLKNIMRSHIPFTGIANVDSNKLAKAVKSYMIEAGLAAIYDEIGKSVAIHGFYPDSDYVSQVVIMPKDGIIYLRHIDKLQSDLKLNPSPLDNGIKLYMAAARPKADGNILMESNPIPRLMKDIT